MLKITIELMPFGYKSTGKSKIIGTGFITNDGTGNEGFGNYRAVFRRTRGVQRGVQNSTVKNFARKQRSAWDLLMLALSNRFK